MRFIVMGMATKETEAGTPPPPEAIAAMQAYNEDFGDGFTPNEEIAKVEY